MVDAETVSTRATFSWKFAIGNRNTGYSRYSLKALSWLAGGCIVDSKIFIRFLPCCSSMFKLSKLSKLCTLSTFQEVSQHRCWDPSVGRPALKKTEERRKMKEKRKNGRKKKTTKNENTTRKESSQRARQAWRTVTHLFAHGGHGARGGTARPSRLTCFSNFEYQIISFHVKALEDDTYRTFVSESVNVCESM